MFQFPLNPVVNQTFTPVAGVTFRWNGTAWFLAGGSTFITQGEGDARYIQLTQKAAANGVATLDAGIKIPAAQLPSTVGITLATEQAAAGTFIDFAIPALVKRVDVMFNTVSTVGASNPMIQLASGGVVEVAGYVMVAGFTTSAPSAGGAAFTTGFTLAAAGAANVSEGCLSLFLQNAAPASRWVCSGNFATQGGATLISLMAGRKTLVGMLDRVRITTVSGVDTFDSGSFNVQYQF